MLGWIIFLLLFGVIDFYAFQALKTVTKSVPIYIIYWLLNLLVMVNLAAHFYGFSFKNYTTSHGYAFAFFATLYLPKLFIIVFLFGEDIYRWFRFGLTNESRSSFTPESLTSRRKFVSQLALGIAAIPFMSFLYGITKGKYNYKVLQYVLYFEDLPQAFDGYKLTQISDIHSGSFNNSSKIQYGIDLINKQQSDVILFTGDLVNAKAEEMNPWINTFKQLKAKDGMYAVLGNHDYGYYAYRDEAKIKENHNKLEAIHKSIGFDLLLNEHRVIDRNGEKLHIVGVENWGASRHFPKKGSLVKATKGIDNKAFNILLSHDPSHFDYKNLEIHNRHKNNKDYITNEPNIVNFNKTIQLTLSGHTHGMQFGIDIPFLNFKWSPVKYRYPKWAGMYKVAEKYLHVNRGFGYLGFPGRVGMWPEITVITLKKGTKPA